MRVTVLAREKNFPREVLVSDAYALQCAFPVAAGLLAGSIAGFVTGHAWLGGGLLAATVPCALMAASRPAAV